MVGAGRRQRAGASEDASARAARSPAEAAEGDDADFYEGRDLEALSDMPRYTSWILAPFRDHLAAARVIEVGAGIGNVAIHYVAATSETLLVEPAPNLHARLRDRVAGFRQARVLRGRLDQVPDADRAPGFDAALLINVLEHIDDDRELLIDLTATLRPGGRLLLFVPALPWLYGSLDAKVQHVRRYTADGLRAAVNGAGLEVERLRYFDVLGVAPWLVMGRILKRRDFDPGSARFYDKIGVPLTAFVERHMVPPLGKSLHCICRKPL